MVSNMVVEIAIYNVDLFHSALFSISCLRKSEYHSQANSTSREVSLSKSSNSHPGPLKSKKLQFFNHVVVGYSLGKAWYSLCTRICPKSPNLIHYYIKEGNKFNIFNIQLPL